MLAITSGKRLRVVGEKGESKLDADIELTQILDYIMASGLTPEEIAARALQRGYKISAATVQNWIYDRVSRPHNHSVNAVMAGLGYTKSWTKVN